MLDLHLEMNSMLKRWVIFSTLFTFKIFCYGCFGIYQISGVVFLHQGKIFLHFEISVEMLICMLNFNTEERKKKGNFHSQPTLI